MLCRYGKADVNSFLEILFLFNVEFFRVRGSFVFFKLNFYEVWKIVRMVAIKHNKERNF
jgi:hypothetical protein